MYKGLVSELQKPNPNVQEIIHLLTTGRPQNFFDKLFRTLSEPQALGIFYYSTSKGNNFFHSSAEKGILSDVLSVINHYKDAILERERVSSDNLHDNLNAVNNAGLTPAHIAIKTDPVALWWLMELKAFLTSSDYSKVLTEGSLSKSPLEFIFENEEIAHNVLKNIFWQVIQSGSWKFFDLFKTESPEVQEKFNKYLKNIPQEVGKFRGATIDSFSKLFQNHWEDILDEPEHGKVTRLIEKIGEINWSELLGKEDWDNNLDKVKEHILTNCSLLYLNKFNPIKHITGKNSTLEHATLEQILLLQSELLDNQEFRKIKRYVENSPNDISDDLETIELTTPDQSEEQKTSISNSNHNHKKLGKRSQKENFIDNKENSSVALNQNQDVTNDKLPFSIESFTSILEEELSKEQHAEIFNAQLEKIKKTATALDRNFKIDLQLCSLISAASKKEFRKIFKHVIDKFEEAPFANKNDFLKEYIENLCNANKAYPNHTVHQILNYAYAITCITQNDDVMKFLVQKIKLGTYQRGTDYLFYISFNLKAKDVMKYLLSEEADLKIDLTYLLSQVQKYPSPESIEIIGHYIQYQKFIKNLADNEGELKKCNEDIFKTILHIAKTSIKSLTRLSQEKGLDDTIEKTTKIYQAIETLIDKYDVKTPKVVGEIHRLLNSLNKHSSKTLKLLPNEASKKNLESLVQDFRVFIFNKYPKDDSYDEQVKNIIDFFVSGNYEELGSSYSSAPSVFPCYPSQKSEYSSSLIGTDSVDTDVIIN